MIVRACACAMMRVRVCDVLWSMAVCDVRVVKRYCVCVCAYVRVRVRVRVCVRVRVR
jgi:hypothetical protein